MRRVTRGPHPTSLVNFAKAWTLELLAEIKKQRKYSKVSNSIKRRYNQDDIKNELDRMYNSLCCYCESRLGVTAFAHIEHRKPKSKFPKLSFEWSNLHLSCPLCNHTKGSQWSTLFPLIDPSNEDPKKHITYNRAFVISKTRRGKTTIRHTGLNRAPLTQARRLVAIRVMELIKDFQIRSESEKRRLKTRLNLLAQSNSEYNSMVECLIEKYLVY